MEFFSLEVAAKKLNTSAKVLIDMAAKGRIVLSMRVPPDLRVGIVTSSSPNTNGKIEVSQTAPLSHLDIPKEELSIPLLNKTLSRYPTYQSGYLERNQQPIDRTRLKPRAFQPDNPDSFQAIWVQVCSHHDYNPAWQHPLDEQKSGESTPSQVKLNKATSLELFNQLQNLHGC